MKNGEERTMRKQEKIIIWPTYFDSSKSRRDGRRVVRSLAVASPGISELKEAADRLKFTCESLADVSYPKMPWLKTGMLLVEKKGSKNQTIDMIARQLFKMRSGSAAA